VRPVLDDGQQDASKATRDHVVRDEAGLITLTGGKLTTFRLMAQDALALAAPHVGQPFARSDAPLFTPASLLHPRWSPAVRQRLQARYGSLAADLCDGARDEDLQCIPGTQTLWIELPWPPATRPWSTWTTCCCAAPGWAFCCRRAHWNTCRASARCAHRTWAGAMRAGRRKSPATAS
jgi:hypothetical protein